MEVRCWNLAEEEEDVIEFIILRLSLQDVCRLAVCSQFFRTVCSSDHIWVQLSKKRWPCDALKFLHSEGKECGCRVHSFLKPSQKGWRDAYRTLHAELARRAKMVVNLMNSRSLNESVEVADYQKAFSLLTTMDLTFEDIVLYFLTPTHSVLVNLVGLHFSIAHLSAEIADVTAALARNQLWSRQVCLRWWTMGGWGNWFRRRDEMTVITCSLHELTEPAQQPLLSVLERGTVHEVLRVQIAADFKSSAWISYDMHSQR